jgi:sulfate adenylyltransferase subunit 1
MELIRISTAGSVDDGKSTLIGRLLYDSNALFEDQIENIISASKKKNIEGIDYSLFTDGLRDERSQGITIDVAHIYFSTTKHKYIIADTPGHVQYTRNMITGMSNADIALILIDVNKGLNEQVKRHIHIASLLKISKIIFCVNKMDLISYEEKRFNYIREEFNLMNETLKMENYTFIPIAAMHGDNVVSKSLNMEWYKGKPILEELVLPDNTHFEGNISSRMPIQCVMNAKQDAVNYRAYAGMVVSGNFTVGEEIIVLPIGMKAKIKSITQNGNKIDEAIKGKSVSIELDHEIDISRGDMISGIDRLPMISNEFNATICWMQEQAMSIPKKLILKIATKDTLAMITNITSKYNNDFNIVIQEPTEVLMNDIARVKLRTATPIYFERYLTNKNLGRFILIDPVSNETVAAGIID